MRKGGTKMTGYGSVSRKIEERLNRAAELYEKYKGGSGSAAYVLNTGKKYNHNQMVSAYTQIMRGFENLKNGLVEPKEIVHLISDFQKINVKMQISAILTLPKGARSAFLKALPENLRNNIIKTMQQMVKEKNLLNPNIIKSSANVA